MSIHPKVYHRNDFEEPKLIGKGAQGEVYLAFNSVIGSNVVLKQLDKQNTIMENVSKEVTILRHLIDVCEDYVLCYIDFMEDEKFFYIITEYLDSQKYMTINDLFGENIELTEDTMIKIIENLKGGLLRIHQKGIAHRDIKPGNIMIDPLNGEVKYIDFGLACHESDCSIVLDKARGSPPYMPPELVLFNIPPHDLQTWISTDLWELGATIWELVTTIPFIDAYYYNHLGKEVERPEDIVWISENIIKGGQVNFKTVLSALCNAYLSKKTKLRQYVYNNLFAMMQINPSERHII
jgi:serine/threonine protein kinase